MQSTMWSKSWEVRRLERGSHWPLSRPQAPHSRRYLLSGALGHMLRDRVNLLGDLHAPGRQAHQEDSKVGAPKIQGQEVPTLCGQRVKLVEQPSLSLGLHLAQYQLNMPHLDHACCHTAPAQPM